MNSIVGNLNHSTQIVQSVESTHEPSEQDKQPNNQPSSQSGEEVVGKVVIRNGKYIVIPNADISKNHSKLVQVVQKDPAVKKQINSLSNFLSDAKTSHNKAGNSLKGQRLTHTTSYVPVVKQGGYVRSHKHGLERSKSTPRLPSEIKPGSSKPNGTWNIFGDIIQTTQVKEESNRELDPFRGLGGGDKSGSIYE